MMSYILYKNKIEFKLCIFVIDLFLVGNCFINEIVMKLYDDVVFSRLIILEDVLFKNNGNVKY